MLLSGGIAWANLHAQAGLHDAEFQRKLFVPHSPITAKMLDTHWGAI
jgi:hypothetical protein